MDILKYIDDYIVSIMTGNEQQQDALEQKGKEHTATYTDVAKAITNLTMGVSEQVSQVEQNNELNLNILIDALVKAELINDDVLGFIQESLENLKENENNDKQ